ncbi:hypothetical protein V1264_025057 [Littorina saxatilis]|uniref:Uncharacterized protein n=2 Tax=Littorina saxatilis TaxID=31220 RepID=A0AAN9ALP0_9CAEN
MVKLNGPRAEYCEESPYVTLDTPEDNFENGDYDCFKFHTSHVGDHVTTFQVKLDPFNDNWLLEYITMRYNNAVSCLKYKQREYFVNSTPQTFMMAM